MKASPVASLRLAIHSDGGASGRDQDDAPRRPSLTVAQRSQVHPRVQTTVGSILSLASDQQQPQSAARQQDQRLAQAQP